MKNPLFQSTEDTYYRVARGGSWYGISRGGRSTRRQTYSPARRYGYTGFRLFRSQEKA